MQQQVMARWLSEQGLDLQGMQPVGGGCIHRTWRLDLRDGSRCFAKTNRAPLLPVLQAEADGLAALREAARFEPTCGPMPTIPEPLALAEREGEAVLLLSWLELGGGSRQGWQDLGAGLARLHRASLVNGETRFGWHQNNFIGSGPQANAWDGSWARFFTEQRLGVQLQQAEAAGRLLAQADGLLEQVPVWLKDHQPNACLVHGDLWSGNAGLLAGGGAALFDPAVYRGDREVDLAMARLFGGFPQAFFEAYNKEWPLPEGHLQRVELYNLYHLLNHANLFGDGYWQQSAASIEALLRHGC
ncbi:fructosamine kinase family protein [Vulcanococcus sp.]|uniref:fructosamine kinase family protein n=1 Tax=Vulcanococcus sp. TaxID=2856995 RepID=UPI003F69E494